MMKKKVLSLVLSVMMLLGARPIGAMADEVPVAENGAQTEAVLLSGETETQVDGETELEQSHLPVIDKQPVGGIFYSDDTGASASNAMAASSTEAPHAAASSAMPASRPSSLRMRLRSRIRQTPRWRQLRLTRISPSSRKCRRISPTISGTA